MRASWLRNWKARKAQHETRRNKAETNALAYSRVTAMEKPSDEVLTHNGIKIDVAFNLLVMPDTEPYKCATIFPPFGSYHWTEEKRKPYLEAMRIVRKRLEELGHEVE